MQVFEVFCAFRVRMFEAVLGTTRSYDIEPNPEKSAYLRSESDANIGTTNPANHQGVRSGKKSVYAYIYTHMYIC